MVCFAAWAALFSTLISTFLISSFCCSLIFISSLPELCRKSPGFLMHFLANSRLARPFCSWGVFVAAARCYSQRSCCFTFLFMGSLRRIHVNIIDCFLLLLLLFGMERNLQFFAAFGICRLLSFSACCRFCLLIYPDFFRQMTDLCHWHLRVPHAVRKRQRRHFDVPSECFFSAFLCIDAQLDETSNQ